MSLPGPAAWSEASPRHLATAYRCCDDIRSVPESCACLPVCQSANQAILPVHRTAHTAPFRLSPSAFPLPPFPFLPPPSRLAAFPPPAPPKRAVRGVRRGCRPHCADAEPPCWCCCCCRCVRPTEESFMTTMRPEPQPMHAALAGQRAGRPARRGSTSCGGTLRHPGRNGQAHWRVAEAIANAPSGGNAAASGHTVSSSRRIGRNTSSSGYPAIQ